MTTVITVPRTVRFLASSRWRRRSMSATPNTSEVYTFYPGDRVQILESGRSISIISFKCASSVMKMGGRHLSEAHSTFHLVVLHKMNWMKAPKRKVQAPGCCEFLSAASAQLIVSRDAAVRAAADRAFSGRLTRSIRRRAATSGSRVPTLILSLPRIEIFLRACNNYLSPASRLLLGAVAGAAAGRGGGAADAGGDLAGQLRALLQQHRGLHRLQLRVSPAELRLGR